MNKIYIGGVLFGFFILSLGVGYSTLNFSGTGSLNIGNPSSPTISNITFTPRLYSTSSNEYRNQNKRMFLNSADGLFVSETYGNFRPSGTVDLIKSDTTNSNCVGENISYYFSGNFTNIDWGKGFRVGSEGTDNYFCPNSGLFSLNLFSLEAETFFETFIVTNNSAITYPPVVVYNSNNELVTLDDRIVFSNAKISIGGIVNREIDINDEFIGGTDDQILSNNLNGINYGTDSKLGLPALYAQVKKNVFSLSRGLTWNTTVNSLTSLTNEFTFVDYQARTATNSNVNNNGAILQLRNSGNGIGINGEKNLVLKGGNLYINDNIYNNNNNSLLTIVVLRDENNLRKGGNVYINPNVTNIDAIIIAEGSILSYNGTTVLNSIDNPNSLRKQLFIYGSVFSRNTIGHNISVFNTDDYINTGSSTPSNKYNFENLRNFQVVRTNQITSGTCNLPNRITALGNNNNTSITYAFAGGKQCYFDDPSTGGLRSTHRTASTVIEYNPNIQLISPKMLKVN